jgi:hypothetical protein
MRLAEIDHLPVILAGEGIGVPLAQEANLVGVHQLIDVRRVRAELAVIHLDRPLVLLTAVHQLQFFIPAEGHRDLGRGYGQRNQDQGHEKENREQHKSFLAPGARNFVAWLVARRIVFHGTTSNSPAPPGRSGRGRGR